MLELPQFKSKTFSRIPNTCAYAHHASWWLPRNADMPERQRAEIEWVESVRFGGIVLAAQWLSQCRQTFLNVGHFVLKLKDSIWHSDHISIQVLAQRLYRHIRDRLPGPLSDILQVLHHRTGYSHIEIFFRHCLAYAHDAYHISIEVSRDFEACAQKLSCKWHK